MVYAERTKKIKNKVCRRLPCGLQTALQAFDSFLSQSHDVLLASQARQNVLDVNHHITQYLYIIEDQQNQISKLKEELNKTTVSASESSEVMSLCEELKALALDQREIR